MAIKIEYLNFFLQLEMLCAILTISWVFSAHNRKEGLQMAVSYNRLWKLLIDKNMTKTQLIKAAKISTNAMAKLGKNQDVRVEVLVKICRALDCTMDDIMEIVPAQE